MVASVSNCTRGSDRGSRSRQGRRRGRCPSPSLLPVVLQLAVAGVSATINVAGAIQTINPESSRTVPELCSLPLLLRQRRR